ncbi:WXG100 family type VII secretion target [Campylobacter devanensis]|uniref:WXG100 family type VII secretion target n=1 Tax=Campylobacter devanensis TaxID=3161138 RepID=UPI000A33F73F|nr:MULTISPECIES: WXG100 family type VII secretion target [unclassified Campylobacter]
MSNVQANPEELEAFANKLMQFLETVSDATNSLTGSFNSLCDTWRDEKRDAFEEDYNEFLNTLERFKENSTEKAEYLRILSARLRDYLES